MVIAKHPRSQGRLTNPELAATPAARSRLKIEKWPWTQLRRYA